MKKYFYSLCMILFGLNLQGQNYIPFQGQAFDLNGKGLNKQLISLKISIDSSSDDNSIVYAERDTVTTDENGLFQLNIGGGSQLSNGSFSAIDWSGMGHFLKVEIDINGGENYQLVSNSKMGVVPFALYAENTDLKNRVNDLEQKYLDLIKYLGDTNRILNFAIDMNDNLYSLVKIGNKYWMKTNLKVSKYNNGDDIPYVPSSEWENIDYGAWCYYGNDPTNEKIYGKLYNWYAATDPRGLAPEGYHVATVSDFEDLSNAIGLNIEELGGSLKSNSYLWKSPNEGSTNSSQFSALPGGLRTNRDGNSGFTKLNEAAWFLVLGESDPVFHGVFYESTFFGRPNSVQYYNYFDKNTGVSIRCVRD